MSTYIVGNHYAFIVMVHSTVTPFFREWWPQTEHEKSLTPKEQPKFIRYEILDLLCLGHKYGNDDVIGSDVLGTFVDQNGNHWYTDNEDTAYVDLYYPHLVGDTAESDAIASLSTKLGYIQAESVSRYLNSIIVMTRLSDRFRTRITGRPDEEELRVLFQAHVLDVAKAVIAAGYNTGYRSMQWKEGRESSERFYYHARYKKNRVTPEEEN